MTEPERFRRAQRLAYDAAIAVADTLSPGVTEKEAAARLEAALIARGVRRWFHAPFAWFGERTRFEGFHGPTGRAKFFPGHTRLEAGMVGILDVAPIVDGCTADIGYTFRAGPADPEYTRARDTLRTVRALIPARIAAGDTMRAIYARVDDAFAAAGFDNRHAIYPFGVLGHRVGRVEEKRLPDPRVGGFGLDALARLLGGELASRIPGVRRSSPLWTADAATPPAPGLWSMEPHLGAKGWGAKFEELLVVEEGGRAWWLDDDLPHVPQS
jgi:Xaa-Pro aminopeptidase